MFPKWNLDFFVYFRKAIHGIKKNDRDDARFEFLTLATTMEDAVPYPLEAKDGGPQEGWRRFASHYAEWKREYSANEIVRKKSGEKAIVPPR